MGALKTTVLALLLIFTIHLTKGQSKREIVNLELQAKEHFENFEFAKALQMYLMLDRYIPHSPSYMYHIGVCYLDMYDSERALPYLMSCAKEPETLSNSLNYYLAKAFHLEHKFDGAVNYYKKYLQGFPNIEKNPAVQDEINREIETCIYGKSLFDNPLDVKIENLGTPVNSKFPEYGAILSADEETIIFTSDRPNTTGGHIYQLDGSYFEDIYISHKTKTGWTEPVSISNNINTWHHDASVALSHDGHQLLFYRYATDNIMHHTSGELYISEFKNGIWNIPVHLPHPINSKSWESSACFSPNDNEIYFTSDRKGGLGGTDIYKTRKLNDGTWTEPENLGPEINTPFNEDSPYLHPDKNTLYFSSNGHRTMGGYDIFVSEQNMETGVWTKPKNLGYPINTAGDDLNFTVSTDGRTIYFSDHRHDSYGDKDIYKATIYDKQADLMVVKGVITDSLTLVNLEAKITVRKDHQDAIESIFNSNMLTGKYVLVLNEGFKYEVTFEVEGHQKFVKIFDTTGLKGYHHKTSNVKMYPIPVIKTSE